MVLLEVLIQKKFMQEQNNMKYGSPIGESFFYIKNNHQLSGGLKSNNIVC